MKRPEMTHKKTHPKEEPAEHPSPRKGTPGRTRLQLALAFILLGALIAAGALLPAKIAGSFDSLLLEKIETQPLAPEDEAPPVTAPLIDRLKLLAAPRSELIILPLQTGGHLSEATIGQTLDQELEDLRARGLYPTADVVRGTSNAHTRYVARASLYLMPTRPDISGIIWEIGLDGESFSSLFYLDDESGKVLSYSVQYEGRGEDVFSKQSGERWTDYLGLAAESLQAMEEAEDVTATDTAIPATSLRFTLETKTSPLEFYCEQYGDTATTSVSLYIGSSKPEPLPSAPHAETIEPAPLVEIS